MSVVKSKRNESKNEFEALYFKLADSVDNLKVETNSVLTFILMQIKMILKQFYHERESEF